jgi:putative ABC transport system permease protein
MLTDLRLAVRLLLRDYRLTIGVCLILSLGVGANAAVFAIIDATLLRPLPYKDAADLVHATPLGNQRAWQDPSADIRGWTHIFSAVSFYSVATEPMTLRGQETTEEAWVGRMAPSLLGTLGLTPNLGRGFTPEDAATGEAVMLGDGFWRRAFNGNRDVIGRTVVLGDRPYTVIGVVPPVMHYAVGTPGRRTVGAVPLRDVLEHEAWLPLTDAAIRSPGSTVPDSIARLRPGLTLTRAKSEARAAIARFRDAQPGTWQMMQLSVADLSSRWPRPPSQALTAVFGAVLFLLLIACADVASLLLFRALTKQQEMAIRASLGASSWRLVRQSMSESVILAAVSGIGATLVAKWVIDVLPFVAPFTAQWLLAVRMPTVGLRVIGFTILVTLGTASLCGAGPALRSARAVSRNLSGGNFVIGVTRDRRSATRAFQAIQVMLTFVLVAGFAVLLTSFINVVGAQVGFDTEGLVFAQIVGKTPSVTRPSNAVLREIAERVKTLPGVQAAILAPNPVSGYFASRVTTETDSSANALVRFARVPVSYFGTAGLSLVGGRPFRADDATAGPVAIVSEATAARFWGGGSAIGRRFRIDEEWITVVGVARNVKTAYFTDPAAPNLTAWLLLRADEELTNNLLIRARPPTQTVLAGLPRLVADVDPTLGVSRAGLVEELYGKAVAPARFYVLIGALLAAIGLLTTTVGLHALVSFSVGQSIREIGVRIALGASPARVGDFVVRRAMQPVGLGLVLGGVGAFVVLPLLNQVSYGTSRSSIVPLVAGAMAITALSAVAMLAPLRRALRVQPSAVLRSE